jgi:multiple sugar transport system ATP-binding protein
MTTVRLQNLRKEFDDVTAVEGIDLEITDGEFVVIVGPSGCGKSTTLRLIAGLETATDGTIRMDGRDVIGVEPKNRNVAMVFQNYALYPHMSGRRNITFGMKSAGDFTDDEIDQRVQEAAETLDIADLLDRKPEAMSGGERQRVALGRAIVRNPDVFLMDEPLSNLDAKLRIQMRAELSKLHKELQTTTIYVTHDQTEAMTLGERVVVMNGGRIQQVAPPQQLYDFPENRFVAEFIGDPAMNIVPTALVRDNDGYALDHPEFRLPLPGAETLEAERDSEVLLGVRPEDLYLAEESGGELRGGIAAMVQVTEPLGDSLLLECTIGTDTVKVQSSPRSGVGYGDTVELAYDPERLHLFDAKTGQTLYHSAPQDSVDRSSQQERSVIE